MNKPTEATRGFKIIDRVHMHRLRALSAGAFTVVALATAACSSASSSAPTNTSAPPAATPAAAVPSPSAVAAERVDGAVQTLAGTTLTLTNGRSFSVPASVRVTRSLAITATDLRGGDYVAVTGTRQADNTLLATSANAHYHHGSRGIIAAEQELPGAALHRVA